MILQGFKNYQFITKDQRYFYDPNYDDLTTNIIHDWFKRFRPGDENAPRITIKTDDCKMHKFFIWRFKLVDNTINPFEVII